MKIVRLVLTFYKSFVLASLIITISSSSIIFKWGLDTFTVIFWFKVITLGLIFYYVNSLKKDDFYYYKNLGLTKNFLWIASLSIDFIFFLLIIIITLKLR